MKTNFGFLLTLALISGMPALAQAAKPSVIGIARSGCVRSEVEGLKPGTPVTLLAHDGKARHSATLGKPVARCGGTESSEPGYALNTKDEFDLALALIGTVPKKWRLRTCASSENIHFLLLPSAKSTRVIAHDYYYLGYDVEADCTAADDKLIEQKAQ